MADHSRPKRACTTYNILLPTGMAAAICVPALAAPTGVLEEVIVTANKREAPMHTLPITMQALSGDELKALGVTRADQILDQLANVSQNASNRVNSGFSIRGVGTNNFHGNVSRAVTVYQDNVAFNNPYSGTLSVFDLNRVEVLRGPQNTLFGRNAMGGAVHYISKRPSPGDDSEGFIRAGVGNLSTANLEGAIEADLNSKLALRLSGASNQQDGMFKNLAEGREGEKLGETDSYGLRLQLGYDNENSQAFWKSEIGNNSGTGLGSKAIGLRDPDDPTQACDFAEITAGSRFDGANNCVTAGGLNPSSDDWFSLYDVGPASQEVNTTKHQFDIHYSLPSFNVSWLSAVQTTDVAFNEDIAAEPELRFIAFQDSEFEQQSHELLLSSTKNSAITWLAGLAYFQEDMDQGTHVRRQLIANGLPITAYNRMIQNEEELSVFGQVDYPIGNNWLLSTGLRFSDNNKQADSLFGVVRTTLSDYSPTTFITREIVTAETGNNPGECPPPVGGIPCTLDVGKLSQSLHNLGGNIKLSYTFSDMQMAYMSYAEGFKSGGFDNRALAAFAGSADKPVEPEFLNATELGLKSFYSDYNLQLNLSAFYYQWHDLQTFDVSEGVPGFLNIPETDISGIEAEIDWIPAHTLSLKTSIGYLQTEIIDSGELSNVDEGHELKNAPKFSATQKVSKHFETAYGNVRINADYRYISSQKDSLNYSEDPYTRKPEQHYLNTSLDFLPAKYPVSISIWGRNLTKERTCFQVIAQDSAYTATSGDLTATLACNPRGGKVLIGADLEYHF